MVAGNVPAPEYPFPGRVTPYVFGNEFVGADLPSPTPALTNRFSGAVGGDPLLYMHFQGREG